MENKIEPLEPSNLNDERWSLKDITENTWHSEVTKKSIENHFTTEIKPLEFPPVMGLITTLIATMPIVYATVSEYGYDKPLYASSTIIQVIYFVVALLSTHTLLRGWMNIRLYGKLERLINKGEVYRLADFKLSHVENIFKFSIQVMILVGFIWLGLTDHPIESLVYYTIAFFGAALITLWGSSCGWRLGHFFTGLPFFLGSIQKEIVQKATVEEKALPGNAELSEDRIAVMLKQKQQDEQD